MDQDFPNDATFEVLDRLVVALDGDLALRHGGAIERRDSGPDAETAEHQRDGGKAQPSVDAVIVHPGRHGKLAWAV